MARGRVAILLVLLVLPLVAQGAAIPSRLVVVFHDEPPALASYGGAAVILSIPSLRAIVVDAPERALLAAAMADARVRYVAHDPDLVRAAAEPNDPRWAQQYAPREIRAIEAWDITTGSAARTLCVLDTGLRATHEDLAGPRALGGIDLVTPDLDAADDNGHGTLVTGIATATTDNARGIAGIAQASFLSAKVLRASGAGPWSAVAAGIVWCVEKGADVLLLSFEAAEGSPIAQAAVAYAHAQGALLVAAAGNAGPCADCVAYPAAFDEVLAVACLTREGATCASSSIGPQVELAAPGQDIVGPWHDADDAYGAGSGTSFAAPHVAGAALLVMTAQPRIAPSEVRAILACTAVDLGPLGRDPATGHGLLDARAALDAALEAGCL